MSKEIYACIECGFETPKWMGKCIRCGQWGSLKKIEVKEGEIGESKSKGSLKIEKLTPYSQIKSHRIRTGSPELDRVLGGGIVPGEVILVGGEPGIGKTTLLLQLLHRIHSFKSKCIYVSAEESFEQLSLHAQRLGLHTDVDFCCDDDIDKILAGLKAKKYAVVVIDSVQTIKTDDLRGITGGVGQVKESTARITDFAKKNGVSVFLISHITKGGEFAGPKVLEHIVDAVFYLEGDKSTNIRILRGLKNRFGSTKEVAVFQFDKKGFLDAKNPSEMFVLSHEPRMGICKGVIFEGNRALIVEIQALIAKTFFSIPQRIVSGLPRVKIQMLCAILSRYTDADLSNKDVYINIANGLKVDDSSLDMAVCLALFSSYLGRKMDSLIVAVGEVSLTGQIHSTPTLKDQVNALVRLGYKNIILPKESYKLIISKSSFSFIDSVSSLKHLLR